MVVKAELVRQRFRRVLSTHVSTGALYLVPRILPLSVVLLLAVRSGLSGLGQAALALSLWQFLLIVCDFGVSQWLLTKRSVTRRELTVAIIGRFALGAFAAMVVLLLSLIGVLDLGRLLTGALTAALVLSFGQMAFSWELMQDRILRATIFAIVEFAMPVLFLFVPASAQTAFCWVLLSKTAISISLTVLSILSMDWSIEAQGLSPWDFGLHTAAWALTSVASGTGELVILQGAVGSAELGVYRLCQTLASLGSIVGFAALAPLMRRSVTGSDIRFPMVVLGMLSTVVVSIAYVVFSLVYRLPASASLSWVVFVCVSLAIASVLSTISVVPMTEVARRVGSKFTLIVGGFSSVSYWTIIAILPRFGLELFAPCAVLAAGMVGIIGNLWAVRSTGRSEPQQGSRRRRSNAQRCALGRQQ